MTERNYGTISWFGIVVNVNDPDKNGATQVRIHGLHDDTQNIPDDKLPWVKPKQDITSAGHNKIGMSPVGLIKGSTVWGHFLDSDRQYPVMHGTIAKAGDADPSSTQNNSTTLQQGTNSTPIAERNQNNKFITRQGRNIKDEDNANTNPQESKDSDGVDITDQAAQKTKFHTMPTIGSIANPAGSILQQLKQVDPQNLTAVLKKAVDNFMKINDMNSFSSSAGASNILGQVMGQVMSQIGASNVIEAMANSIPDPTQLSVNAQMVILSALQNLGPSPNSDTVLGIIGNTLAPLLNDILNLINSKTLNLQTLEALIDNYLASITNAGQLATVGANPGSILGMLSSIIPQLSGPINSTLNSHLPPSVLDQGKITQALQKFAMSQAFIKKPTSGKKALAMAAVQQSFDASGISNIISGLSSQAQTFISAINPIAN